ncbi:MAG: hypothetical protein CME06_00195 [Gemmatimonadetes bacterium]|nr:hypothetical protein [Gemmatimonadota bacterium]
MNGEPRDSPKATWFPYLALCISVSICILLLQYLLQPAIDGPIWGMLLHNALSDGPEIQRIHLDENWSTDRLSYPSGIFRNRLVLVQRAALRSREPVHLGDAPWELRLSARAMEFVGPYRHDKRLTGTAFELMFAPAGADAISFRIDEPLSSAIELRVRRRERALEVSLGDSLIESVQFSGRFEQAFLEILALPGSLVAFDDLLIGPLDRKGGIVPTFEERFNARSVLGRPIGTELEGEGSRAAVTLCIVLLLLAIDLAVTHRLGRSSTTDALLILMLPGGLLALSIQSFLQLPFVPVLSAVLIVWISKTILALGSNRNGNNVVVPILLCGLQTLHWIWFRLFWGFVGIGSVAIATAIPMALILGSLRARQGIRLLPKLSALLMVIGATEFLLRSLPTDRMLDIEWRNRNIFWDLEHDTAIFGEPEGEFEDGSDLIFSVEKPHGRYRIACLGSSSTFGIGAAEAPHENYPRQLGQRLRSCCGSEFEVINAGLGGKHLTQLRVYYEEVLSCLEPDLVIVYFGHNGDRPSDIDYFERVEALVARSPELEYPTEVHAALGLGIRNRWLVHAYLLASRSRLFVGLSVIAEAIESGRESEQQRSEGASSSPRPGEAESVQILADAIVSSGAELLLIPEITAIGADHPYETIFAEVAEGCDRVHFYQALGIDRARDLVDKCHMNGSGYRRLARSIANHLIEMEMVVCDFEPQLPRANDLLQIPH